MACAGRTGALIRPSGCVRMKAGPLGSSGGGKPIRARPGGLVVVVVRSCARRVQPGSPVVGLPRAGARERGQSPRTGTPVSVGHDGRETGGRTPAVAGTGLARRQDRAARGILPRQRLDAVRLPGRGRDLLAGDARGLPCLEPGPRRFPPLTRARAVRLVFHDRPHGVVERSCPVRFHAPGEVEQVTAPLPSRAQSVRRSERLPIRPPGAGRVSPSLARQQWSISPPRAHWTAHRFGSGGILWPLGCLG